MDGTIDLQRDNGRWRGETGCCAPRAPNNPLSINGTRLSFLLSFSFWPRPTGQKNGLATVLGEACGVDETDRRAGRMLTGAFPCLYQEPAGWHIHM